MPNDDNARDDCHAALRRAARRWRVRLAGALAHSATGCVAFGRATSAAGQVRSVVVKVLGGRSDEGCAWAALRHYAGAGSVRLLDHADGASLLERAVPGRALSALVRAGRDDAATAILCDVATALHEREAPDAGAPAFPSTDDWGRGFARYRRSGDAAISAALVDRAAAIFDELVRSQDAPRLLHGDLHHDNVLLDAGRGWLAIDPKGVRGEPSYELGAALRNPWGAGVAPALCASPPVVDRRSRIIAERLGHDRQRVLAWGFAQAVLSAVWSREDGDAPDHPLAVAEAISRIRGVR